MTELEHFIRRNDVEANGKICAIALSIKNKIDGYCECKGCEICIFPRNKDEILKILLSEHKEKPKLTDDEKAILRNVDSVFTRIARDRNGNIYIYEKKPFKNTKIDAWCDGGSYIKFVAFNHLFQFITWEDKEPWFIPDLLED